jgi:hypothetical protein
MLLDLIKKQKRLFDVNNKKDVAEYKKFLQTGAWGEDGCPFVVVWPYVTITHMIQDKIVHKVLGVKNEKCRH